MCQSVLPIQSNKCTATIKNGIKFRHLKDSKISDSYLYGIICFTEPPICVICHSIYLRFAFNRVKLSIECVIILPTTKQLNGFKTLFPSFCIKEPPSAQYFPTDLNAWRGFAYPCHVKLRQKRLKIPVRN